MYVERRQREDVNQKGFEKEREKEIENERERDRE